MGDLNYRIDDFDADYVKNLITKNDYATLLKYDQLNEQKRLGRVFVYYEEADVKFKPTYKYDPGTDDWDSRQVFFYIILSMKKITTFSFFFTSNRFFKFCLAISKELQLIVIVFFGKEN